ncbi:Toxin co-regulated pilus biosynthesis protein Q [Burkholderia sp. D7]|nr:Toxin co-regulated pilus biosynthesis protein Q [Burkholderia sp. D7]
MKLLTVIQTQRRAVLVAQIIAALTLASFGSLSFAATEPDQSQVAPPAGDGWQALSASASVPKALSTTAIATPTPAAATKVSAVAPQSSSPLAATPGTSYAVVPVVVSGAPQGVAPAGNLSLVITPQDMNLRNALDRWLQKQGWQLAWKIDDDLPLEFNATFSGDFDSLLTQVMRATNHMRTPTRVCEHTNNVIRVVARAANCQD